MRVNAEFAIAALLGMLLFFLRSLLTFEVLTSSNSTPIFHLLICFSITRLNRKDVSIKLFAKNLLELLLGRLNCPIPKLLRKFRLVANWVPQKGRTRGVDFDSKMNTVHFLQ